MKIWKIKYLTFEHFNFIILLLLLMLTACRQNDKKIRVDLNILHVVKGVPLQFEDKIYQTKAGNPYVVYRLKYYLSDFTFTGEDESIFLVDTAILCNAKEPESCRIHFNDIPLKSYKKLSFILGLSEQKNVEGGLENTMKNNRMEWPIIGEKGYHFMKFEGRYDSLTTGKWLNFNLHTGPTGNHKNYVIIQLPLPKIVKRKDFQINMEMDIDRLLHGPVDYNFATFGQSIMGNQNAQQTIKDNAKDVFRIMSVK